MNNPLWEYSLARYSLDGVAPLCLRLQDEFSVDVNLLLYADWLGSLNLALSLPHLQQLDALVAPWREDVIKPLRTLRRQLKGMEATQASSAEIKALELSAEEQQQDMMVGFYRSAPGLPSAAAAQLGNLQLVGQLGQPDATGRAAMIEQLAVLLKR